MYLVTDCPFSCGFGLAFQYGPLCLQADLLGLVLRLSYGFWRWVGCELIFRLLLMEGVGHGDVPTYPGEWSREVQSWGSFPHIWPRIVCRLGALLPLPGGRGPHSTAGLPTLDGLGLRCAVSVWPFLV